MASSGTSLTKVAEVTSSNAALVLEKGRKHNKGAVEDNDPGLPSSVLVIEDSPSDRLLLVEMLREVNGVMKVSTSGSLKEALDAIAGSTFDLIVLDLSLPDAEELEGLLILVDRLPTTPIIVVTAHPGDSFVYEALSHGADEYLSKNDLNVRRVRDGVQRAMGRRAGRRRYDRFNISAARALNMILTPAVALAVTGQIVATNGAWDLEAFENGGTIEGTGVGVNYLSVCARAVGEFTFGALEVSAGIDSVFAGQRENFSFDYPCPRNGVDRWFNVRVVPLTNSGGGAIVTHVEVTNARKAEQELGRRQSLFRSSNDMALSSPYANNSAIYALVDAQGKVVHASGSTRRLLGSGLLNSQSAEVLGRVDPLDLERASEVFEQVAALSGASEALVVRVIDRNGRQRSIDLTLTNLLHDPAVHAIVVSGTDITESRNVQIAERIASRLLDSLPASVVVTDYSGTVVYWNDRASSLYGYSAEETIGRTIKELGIRPGTEAAIDDVVLSSGRWEGDIEARCADGNMVSVHAIIERIEAPDIDFKGIVSSSMDISERRQLEESLLHQSRYDSITDLPNRHHFIDRVDTALRSRGEDDEPLLIFLIDFDDFWAINDRFGYEFGNETLVAWSKLATGILSPTDFLAHLGGDEFAVCRKSASAIDFGADFTQKIRDISSSIMNVGEETVSFTIAIGVARSIRNSTAEGLLRNADSAMYSAKEVGRAQIEIFDDKFHDDLRGRQSLRQELAKAVEEREIKAFFQPIVRLDTGEIAGFEALARWPQRDFTPPTVFIPLAEESGLIGKIGALMLESSCEALSAWKVISPDRQLTVAVNVSALQLLDPTFPKTVRDACHRFNVDANNICLEVTETALVDEALVFHALHELKAVGVRVAIDDFGTGYSSLLRLHRFPLDFLKIDKSFVDELKSAQRNSVVISAIRGIASALDFGTIAEGIEGELQWQRLREMGCEEGQGFLYSKAVSFEESKALIATNVRYTPDAGVASGSVRVGA